MNRTLLLILCDFLLLTLLALTDWEKAAPAAAQPPPAASSKPAANAATKDDALVSVMKLSLGDERAQRCQHSEQLQTTRTDLTEREKTLAASRAKADTLSSQYATAAAEAQ